MQRILEWTGADKVTRKKVLIGLFVRKTDARSLFIKMQGVACFEVLQHLRNFCQMRAACIKKQLGKTASGKVVSYKCSQHHIHHLLRWTIGIRGSLL